MRAGVMMIDLHTTPTANGYKASIMLEEAGLPYRAINYNLVQGEHLRPEYLAINPVGRMPAIVDHDPLDVDPADGAAKRGAPLNVYGTAAILLYLAEKTQRFMPVTLSGRAQVYQWLGIISSDIGPAYSGQFVFSVMAPEKLPWAIGFYDKLCTRLVQTMEQQLGKTRYLAGEDYTIADMIAYPVPLLSMKRYPGNLDAYPNIARWAEQVGARPAVQRGMKVPS
jgi:GST-like protein